MKPTGLFAHGFWDFADQVDKYKGMLPKSLKTFSFPDAEGRKFHLSQVNMAQEGDMATLLKAYEKMIKKDDDKELL